MERNGSDRRRSRTPSATNSDCKLCGVRALVVPGGASKLVSHKSLGGRSRPKLHVPTIVVLLLPRPITRPSVGRRKGVSSEDTTKSSSPKGPAPCVRCVVQ